MLHTGVEGRPASIRATQPRTQRIAAMLYVFGDYTLDTQRCELHRAGHLVNVRPKVFQVLAYLLAHRDRIIHKQELREQLWPGQFVSDVTLDACMAEARRAVGDSGQAQRMI